MSIAHKPIALIVLDGWGHSDQDYFNAIAAAKKPTWDRLLKECPNSFLRASGTQVGLPSDQMGNSEVGHLNLGSGRVVYQEFTRVSRAIKTGSFYSNTTLTDVVDLVIASGRALHLIGLLSPGGVHSHEEHIHAMAELAVRRGAKRLYLHAFLDGRDTPPKSAHASLQAMQNKFAELGAGRIASIIGRYFAMDRDHRWPRIKAAYDLLTQGKAKYHAQDAIAALNLAYQRNETDEFVQATSIVPPGTEPVRMADGDAVVFMNYRSDRARQITRAIWDSEFDGFERDYVPKLASFVTLTEYSKDFKIRAAFPPDRLNNVFGEYISKLGLHQLRIAETEKYAHVTFFFNGGEEQQFPGEDRILVPSPNVATYDLKPQMSAFAVTDKLVEAIHKGNYDVIICNFANADMVGHTGNFNAAVKAIEALDLCLARTLEALEAVGGEALITADHGNAEKMLDATTTQAHTAHTTNLVPFIYVGRPARISENGILADVAPSMLRIMGLAQPQEMTGRPLIELI